ncbi:M1-specific T cell receptor beta chain-like [Polyodon spathula]|uniref:M1-specific T cell receptor beta chain-like n=1 Tax=Polyodon spathula TaxID=7913 RepID=UPI001B7E9D18|nr:M1-specific T cell receptor beta chain-like [Polyodon spathula]
MHHVFLPFGVIAFLHYAESQSALKVTQWPPVAVVSLRQSVEINCNQSASNIYMYWYRQQNSSELQLVFYSPYGSDPEKGENIPDRFTVTRTQMDRISLNIKNAEAEDTGVYYCAASATQPANFGEGTKLTVLVKEMKCTCSWWFCYSSEKVCSNSEQYFGDGTRLTVLEHNISEPNLHILEPSKEETVKKKRVTLVCLATGFYPDHIHITWKINGKDRENRVKTDDHATKDKSKNTYSISSRLRLTPREWFNPENSFACIAKFYKETDKAISIVEYIRAKDGCGTTQDSYQKSSAAAKFSYTLFIGKSVLYGLLLAVLVWKFRPSPSKRVS